MKLIQITKQHRSGRVETIRPYPRTVAERSADIMADADATVAEIEEQLS